MATSHSELKNRLDRLAISLLPIDKDTQVFLKSEEDRMHAYVLLAHAELEEYLEELGRDVVLKAERLSGSNSCAPVISRLIYLKNKGTGKFNQATPDAIATAVKFYQDIVNANNGIKEPNVMALFMPLGLTHDDFNSTLMGNLNTFGRVRGGIAHTAQKLRQGVQPSAERKAVDDILGDLLSLDTKVRALR
jgi:hypothetical protein